MKKMFWASKIHVFNISSDEFLKTKYHRRNQVKESGDNFEDFLRLFHGQYFILGTNYMIK